MKAVSSTEQTENKHSPKYLFLQYPPGYLAAMANKTKKEACARPGRGGRGKHYPGRGRPRRRKIKTKEELEEEEEGLEEEEAEEGEEQGDEPPEAQMQEDAPQSNGDQKTTGETGGCFYRCCSKQVRKGGQVSESSVITENLF